MGQINIGGTSASVQLQGNNTITSDQAFTFPDTGGELAVNTSGSGQVAGYQQGVWTPYAAATSDFTLSGCSAYNAQIGNWVRVGNLVTCHFWLQSATDSWNYQNNTGELDNFYMAGLPYAVNSTFPFVTGSGVISYLQNNTFKNANGLAMTYRCHPQTGSSGGPSIIVFVYSYQETATVGRDTGVNYQKIFGNLGSGIQGSVSYVTDDTTWTPQNGATLS